MEQDLLQVGINAAKGNVVSIKLDAFDLSTDPCLPHPLETGYKSAHTWLIVIMVVCILSTFFSAYSERWRSQICNMFYPNRAEPRAKYLAQRIKVCWIIFKFGALVSLNTRSSHAILFN